VVNAADHAIGKERPAKRWKAVPPPLGRFEVLADVSTLSLEMGFLVRADAALTTGTKAVLGRCTLLSAYPPCHGAIGGRALCGGAGSGRLQLVIRSCCCSRLPRSLALLVGQE
jgi:hypothetical protein